MSDDLDLTEYGAAIVDGMPPAAALHLALARIRYLEEREDSIRIEAAQLAEPLCILIIRELIDFEECSCKGRKVCRPCKATEAVQTYHKAFDALVKGA